MHRTFLGPVALFFIVGGSVETGTRALQWNQNRDLDQKGLVAKAQVISKFVGDEGSGRYHGPATFWLIARFIPAGAEQVDAHIQVPKSYFDAHGVPESNVAVRYLPNSPEVAFVEGARRPLPSIFIGPSILLAGFAMGAGWLWRRLRGLPPA